MVRSTHIAAGAASYVAIVGPDPTGIIIAGVASILPDLDVYLPIGHRGPTHSLLAVIALYAFLTAVYPSIATAVIVGYLSHLILDSFTVARIPWLWPMQKRFGLPVFYTGGLGDCVFRWSAVALFFLFLFASMPGVWV